MASVCQDFVYRMQQNEVGQRGREEGVGGYGGRWGNGKQSSLQ